MTEEESSMIDARELEIDWDEINASSKSSEAALLTLLDETDAHLDEEDVCIVDAEPITYSRESVAPGDAFIVAAVGGYEEAKFHVFLVDYHYQSNLNGLYAGFIGWFSPDAVAEHGDNLIHAHFDSRDAGVAEYVREYLESHPEIRSVGWMPKDGYWRFDGDEYPLDIREVEEED